MPRGRTWALCLPAPSGTEHEVLTTQGACQRSAKLTWDGAESAKKSWARCLWPGDIFPKEQEPKLCFQYDHNQEIQTKAWHRKRGKNSSQKKKIHENSKVFLSRGTMGVCFSLLLLSEFSKFSVIILNVGGNQINFIFKITYNIKAL